ncbi:hypothetical protein TSOC_011186, partial [Tetrabaena socialis]
MAATNYDHSGDNIGQAPSSVDALSKCNADSICNGFNSDGYYKSSLSNPHYESGVCLYKKVATTCPQFTGYTVAADTDHSWDDLGQVPFAMDAMSKCNADSMCNGFNSGGYYKSSISNPHYERG